MTRLIKMRYSNDCSIASVAMATRLSYEECFNTAVKHGFKPNSDYGFDLGSLLNYLGFDFDCRPFFPWARRNLPLVQPFIASVNSVNNIGGFHAIVVEHGRVFDPSNKRQVSFERFMKTRRHLYFNLERYR